MLCADIVSGSVVIRDPQPEVVDTCAVVYFNAAEALQIQSLSVNVLANMSAADGMQIGLAIGVAWAVAWGFKMVMRFLDRWMEQGSAE